MSPTLAPSTEFSRSSNVLSAKVGASLTSVTLTVIVAVSVKTGFPPDFDGWLHADRPQPNKHAGVVEKLVCSAYLNICVDFSDNIG